MEMVGGNGLNRHETRAEKCYKSLEFNWKYECIVLDKKEFL